MLLYFCQVYEWPCSPARSLADSRCHACRESSARRLEHCLTLEKCFTNSPPESGTSEGARHGSPQETGRRRGASERTLTGKRPASAVYLFIYLFCAADSRRTLQFSGK